MQAESTATVRSLRRTEERCFEVVGSWAAAATEPAAKVLLNELSRHHAWRAAQWADLDAGVPAPGPGDPGDDPSGTVVAALGAGPVDGATALARWADEVAPALAARYEQLTEGFDPVAGAPVARAAHRCRADLALDRSAVGTPSAGRDGPPTPSGG